MIGLQNESVMQNAAESILHPRVRAALAQAGVPYTLRPYAECGIPITGPQDFATAISVSAERITKTLLLAEQNGQRRLVVLCCSVQGKIDLRAVASRLGYGRLEVASSEQLERELGYPRFGVSPLGVPESIPVLLDDEIMGYETILIGAGQQGGEIEISPTDLLAITRAISGPFCKTI